jgi:hypothetical protein
MKDQFDEEQLTKVVCATCHKTLGSFPSEFADDEMQAHYELEHMGDDE